MRDRNATVLWQSAIRTRLQDNVMWTENMDTSALIHATAEAIGVPPHFFRLGVNERVAGSLLSRLGDLCRSHLLQVKAFDAYYTVDGDRRTAISHPTPMANLIERFVNPYRSGDTPSSYEGKRAEFASMMRDYKVDWAAHYGTDWAECFSAFIAEYADRTAEVGE